VARFEGVLAGTGVIPSYGRALLDADDLQRLAQQLLDSPVPMVVDHDLDQLVDSTIVTAEVRDGPDGERQLFVEFDVPDDQVNAIGGRQGMSVSFNKPLIVPREGEPDIGLWVDPGAFTLPELQVGLQRLDRAGFRPVGGLYVQLSELPPPAVVLDIAQVAQVVFWGLVTNGLYDVLKVFLRRGDKTRFKFRIHKEEGKSVTAEIETSSESGLRAGLTALRALDAHNDGLFILRAGEWRQPGTSGRRRRAAASKRKPPDR